MSEVVRVHRGEHRWPMALAVIVASVLHAALPVELKAQQSLFLPLLCGLILVILILADPGRINRVQRWTRVVTVILFGFITLANALSVYLLIVGILDNASFETARALLFSGAAVWFTNVIAFSLWYWDLDAGGAAARANQTGPSAALIFPEMTHREHVPEGWYPKYVDYLTFSFSTALAFSPTDVSAVKAWAKLMMVAEAVISLAVAALVIARAINII
jgi:uncharacterized membrane protein